MGFDAAFLRGVTTTVTFTHMREVQSGASGGITHEVDQVSSAVVASIHPLSGSEVGAVLLRSGEAVVAQILCRPRDVPFELREGDIAEFFDGRRTKVYKVGSAQDIGQRGKVLSVDVAENVVDP